MDESASQTPQVIQSAPSEPPKHSKNLTIKISYRILCVLLLLIIVALLALWQPWQDQVTAVTRKITITGTSTVTATPDEFVFYPDFERVGTDVNAMKNDLNTFGNKMLADLQQLGIPKSKIKLDSSSYDRYYYDSNKNSPQTISLYVTITATNEDLAQKVQNYLTKTDAKGQLTAEPQFSKDKQKSLENQARQKAIADARSKADQTVKTLGVKLGKVVEVKDSSNRSFGPSILNGANSADDTASKTTSLQVTPGENDIDFSVQVTFALK